MFNENLRLVFQYVLLIIYILLFFLQIVLFIHFIKRKNKYWIYPAGTALISCMAAIILMFFMTAYLDMDLCRDSHILQNGFILFVQVLFLPVC